MWWDNKVIIVFFSSDEQGIFEGGPTTSDNPSELNPALKQAEIDVEKALASFEKNGKLPASVMEASIFRKPYFVGRCVW